MNEFNKVHSFVERYFKEQLEEGRTVNEIVDMFRSVPLNGDLKMSGYTPLELRRHGQLVGSRYLLKQSQEKSLKAQL